MKAKLAQWSHLTLRQDFADEAWMRAHLRVAGVSVKYDVEPATVERLRALLRRACVSRLDAENAVGRDLSGFLAMNLGLPLWAAVALVLEATGRFTPKSQARIPKATT